MVVLVEFRNNCLMLLKRRVCPSPFADSSRSEVEQRTQVGTNKSDKEHDESEKPRQTLKPNISEHLDSFPAMLYECTITDQISALLVRHANPEIYKMPAGKSLIFRLFGIVEF